MKAAGRARLPGNRGLFLPPAACTGVVAASAWIVLALVVFQAYCSLVLFLGPGGARPARWSLGLLFLLNAVHTGVGFLYRDLLGVVTPSATVWVDWLTNGALVVAAELTTAHLRGRRPWVGALPVAAVSVIGLELWTLAGGMETWTPLLLAYAYASIRFATAVRETRGTPGQAGAVWVLAAFSPRFLELALDGVLSTEWSLLALAPITLVLAVVILLASAAGARELLRPPLTHRTMVALVFMASGVLLGATRVLTGGASDLVTVLFTLAVLRPAGILAGVAEGALFGAPMPARRMGRHAALMATGVGVYAAILSAAPAFMPQRAPLVDGLFAFALTLVLLPLFGLGLERWTGRRETAAAPAMDRPRSAPLGKADGDIQMTLPTGLDPACRFTAEDVLAYERARAHAAAQPPERRAALAALTRRERVLLGLLGSSRETLGDARFSQAGLQWATHIPYRYLSTVIREVNRTSTPFILSSSGVRGLRYYWLSPSGAKAAAQLAEELGLEGEANLRELLGEAFYRAKSLAESRAS